MALVLAVALGCLVAAVWRNPAAGPGWKVLAALVAILVASQISLGAAVIWTARNPCITTAHVVIGALTLSTTFLLTWAMHRNTVEWVADVTEGLPPSDEPAVARIPARA